MVSRKNRLDKDTIAMISLFLQSGTQQMQTFLTVIILIIAFAAFAYSVASVLGWKGTIAVPLIFAIVGIVTVFILGWAVYRNCRLRRNLCRRLGHDKDTEKLLKDLYIKKKCI